MSMTKAEYIQMAIEARTPFSEVIETAKRFEEYCEAKDDLVLGGHQGPTAYMFPGVAFNYGDMLEDANGNRWALVRSI